MLRHGRKYCSVECANKGLVGRISPMKGKHHTEETRLKISAHSKGKIGKPPSKIAVQALLDYNKEHGSCNKKYANPDERAATFRKRHKEQIIARNKSLHPYKNWNRRIDYLYRNLKARHGSVPYGLEEFRNWMNTQAKFCYLCGRILNLEEYRGVQLDHIMPVKKGGTPELVNLGLACRQCNDIKNCYSIEEVMETVEKWKRNICQIQE